MKVSIITALVVLFALSSHGQVFGTNCPTYEQQQAEYNRKLAAGIVVTNTTTQQQQTYYQQLATYYQQVDKDNQQKAKDAQQMAKDQQQAATDAQQKATAIQQAATAAQLAQQQQQVQQVLPDPNPWIADGYGGWKKIQCGEVWLCDCNGNITVEGIPLDDALRIKGMCAYVSNQDYVQAKADYKANRSGGGDGTNPGGGGNVRGFINPHNVK